MTASSPTMTPRSTLRRTSSAPARHGDVRAKRETAQHRDWRSGRQPENESAKSDHVFCGRFLHSVMNARRRGALLTRANAEERHHVNGDGRGHRQNRVAEKFARFEPRDGQQRKGPKGLQHIGHLVTVG